MYASQRSSCPSFFQPSTNRRIYRLLSKGLIGAPCGVPRPSSRLRVLRCFFPRSSVSSTGASSHILIRCSIAPSTTRRATDFISSACGIAIEVAAEICVYNLPMASVDQLMDMPYGVQCAAVCPIGVLLRLQIGLEYRFEHQHCRRFHRSDPGWWAPLTAAAFHPAWGCIPAAPVAVDTFDFSVLAPVRPTTAPHRTPRCPQRSDRPLLLLRHWLCSIGRQTPEHPCGTPCRTARGNEGRAIPSLCRATPSATSEHLLGLLGSSPIPRPSSLLASPFN